MPDTPNARLSALPIADDHDVLIIIPTVATPSMLLPTLRRLATRTDGYRVRIVVAVNPVDVDGAPSDAEIAKAMSEADAERVELMIWRHPGPAGFSGAINRGLLAACGLIPRNYASGPQLAPGVPPVTIVFNDDLRVAHGWLRGLVTALDTELVHHFGDVPDADGTFTLRPAEHFGPIGMAGPVSNCAGGAQVVQDPGLDDRMAALGIDGFALEWRRENKLINTTVFLSGLCTAFRRDCLLDLLISCDGLPDGPALYDEDRYPIAGFEDNDTSHRADLLGWRSVIDTRTFIAHIGHQTFKLHFPDMDLGLRNRQAYYSKWALPHRPHEPVQPGERLVGAYRVRFDVPFDFDLFRMSLAAAGNVLDGVAVLLTGPLSRIQASDESIGPEIQNLLLASRQPGGDAKALGDWIRHWTSHRSGNRAPVVKVAVWDGEANERHERNALIELAEGMGADWILSIDHDETIENRVGRPAFERLMRHPDPLLRAWDFSWCNHWDSQRAMNVSRPWGDDGTFRGGMRGFRMFRVASANPRRIHCGTENGLHCGNVPLFCPVSIRTSGIRFRHFGYLRPQDRARKLDRYRQVDPDPSAVMIGGANYDHIGLEENQRMSAFYPVNGIGLHMLVHHERQLTDLGRHLDVMYGLTDRIVLVWTGEWTDKDKRGFVEVAPCPPRPDGVGAEVGGGLRSTLVLDPRVVVDSCTTGPSLAMARLAHSFGAEWVHEPLNDDFANARNAGIDALHGTPGIGWALFIDPDEYLPPEAMISLRRMAEATDAWAWLVRFRNQTGNGPNDWNHSESVRMTRLDEHRVMRMTGRVHESFSAATRGLVDAGKRNVVRVCPVEWTNTGLALSPEAMEHKLGMYRRLTEKMLTEDPSQAGSWVTLGLFWANEGANGTHMECLNRAMACAKDGEYLPFYEAGRLYMRLALATLTEAESRMGNHPDRKVVDAMIEFLSSAAPSVPRSGLVASGEREPIPDHEAIATLPAFLG